MFISIVMSEWSFFFFFFFFSSFFFVRESSQQMHRLSDSKIWTQFSFAFCFYSCSVVTDSQSEMHWRNFLRRIGSRIVSFSGGWRTTGLVQWTCQSDSLVYRNFMKCQLLDGMTLIEVWSLGLTLPSFGFTPYKFIVHWLRAMFAVFNCNEGLVRRQTRCTSQL